MKGFELYKTADDKYYRIGFVGHDAIKNLEENYTSSYYVLAARLLGLKYDDFLIFCRAHGAKLRGKTGYCFPIWKEETRAQEVIKILNKEWKILESFLKEN